MEKKTISSRTSEDGNVASRPPKRKGVLIWGSACVLLSFWMFFLGILVGRGTAPVQFDTQSLQKELLALKKAAVEKTLRQYETDSKNADERKGVVFYDVLKRSGDGPDPQWSPRPTRQPMSQWPPELPAPSVPLAPLGQPALQVPSGASEPPGVSESAKLPGASAALPGLGMQKPATQTKDPNTPVPMKVMPEAFKKPAMLKNTAMLKNAEVLKIPEISKSPEKVINSVPTAGSWTIQVAALKDTPEADRIVAKLRQQGYPASRLTGEIVGKGVWHRVRIGPYQRREEADAVVDRLTKEGLSPIAINTGGGKE
jgi:cell division protein FtsN